jgi:hypothetical protein
MPPLGPPPNAAAMTALMTLRPPLGMMPPGMPPPVGIPPPITSKPSNE